MKSSQWPYAALVFVLVIAAFFRLYGLAWDSGYLFHPDERKIVLVASGLAWRTGILDGTVIAFREVNEWKFVKPVFIDDVVHAELQALETKALPRIGGGSVVVAVELKNQDNDACMRGKWTLLVMSRPKAANTEAANAQAS